MSAEAPGVVYAGVPGFERYRVGSDRSVWVLRSRPGEPPRWERMSAQTKKGTPNYELRRDGQSYVRVEDLLYRAAFAPPELRAGWAERLGRKLPKARAKPPAPPAPILTQVEAAAPAPPAELAAGAADPVEYRLLPGWPGYRVGRDWTVWSCLPSGRRPKQGPAKVAPWRLVEGTRDPKRAGDVRLGLQRDGRREFLALAAVVRSAFPEIPPDERPPSAAPLEPDSPSPAPAPPPAELEEAPAPAEPPPVEYRAIPVAGFERYRLGTDRSVVDHGRMSPWGRRVEPVVSTDGRSRVLLIFRHETRWLERLFDVADLVEATFPERAIAAGDGRPEGVAYRPVPDVPDVEAGSDGSIWRRDPSSARLLLGLPAPWVRLVIQRAPRRRPFVDLQRDGREVRRAVEDLMREAFTPPPPTLPSGRPGPEVHHRGSAHPKAKLDESRVAESRRLKAQGWTYAELIERFGCSKSTLEKAILGLTWRHVPMPSAPAWVTRNLPR